MCKLAPLLHEVHATQRSSLNLGGGIVICASFVFYIKCYLMKVQGNKIRTDLQSIYFVRYVTDQSSVHLLVAQIDVHTSSGSCRLIELFVKTMNSVLTVNFFVAPSHAKHYVSCEILCKFYALQSRLLSS